MHKCTHECRGHRLSLVLSKCEWPLVWWLSQSWTVGQCSHVMVHCSHMEHHEWNVVLGCGYTLTSVTHLCFVKHISPMFHQHLQYREVVLHCSIHHWCPWLQERTIKWYSHRDVGIHMLPPPIYPLSPFTHPPHHIRLFTTTLVCVWQGVGWIKGTSVPLNKPWGMALFVASSRDTSIAKIKHPPNNSRTV